MRNNRGISIVDEIVLAAIVLVIIFGLVCWLWGIDPVPTINAVLDYIIVAITR